MSLSLWLVPRDDSPFTKATQELISDTVPRNFLANDKVQSFPPHVTVTSGISLENTSPQQWLDGLDLSGFQPQDNEVVLQLDRVEAEDPFFRKMNIALEDNANLTHLVALSRTSAGLDEEFAKNGFRPHLSLFYGDVPTSEVKQKAPLIEMKIGFTYGDLFACCGGALCLGGYLVLVDTSKPIQDWHASIVARRETPWATWRASRSLL